MFTRSNGLENGERGRIPAPGGGDLRKSGDDGQKAPAEDPDGVRMSAATTEPVSEQEPVDNFEAAGISKTTNETGGSDIGINYPGTVLTFDKIETFQGARVYSRQRMVSALEQLLVDVDTGNLPWELLVPNSASEVKNKEGPGDGRNGAFERPASVDVSLERAEENTSFSVFASLVKEMAQGRALVACPCWLLLMLVFLAATALAMIAEQGLLRSGVLTHFLGRVWIFMKLGLVFLAAAAALAGLVNTLFVKPSSLNNRMGIVFWPEQKTGERVKKAG
jgi:hypothetical protein